MSETATLARLGLSCAEAHSPHGAVVGDGGVSSAVEVDHGHGDIGLAREVVGRRQVARVGADGTDLEQERRAFVKWKS